ncbi:MAG: group III truncated hemoglobin [Verrucomicrobiota bacterium]
MNDSLLNRLGGRPALLKLLHHFYADVRQHQVIGPIFTAHITDWTHHLEKIADFWSTIAGGPPAYSGPMVAKHMPLNLKEEHFQVWLGLWEHNCKIWLPADCAGEMIQFAQNIALRLRMACGVPVTGDKLGTAIALGQRTYGKPKPLAIQPVN